MESYNETNRTLRNFSSSVRNHLEHSGKSNTFCWRNISVWRKEESKKFHFRGQVKPSPVRILKNVNGFVSENSLVAIMGPSGSGKTTMLSAISLRLKEGMQGNVYLNGEAVSSAQMMTLSGFVPQYDMCVESLTALEHMKFMANLKMDPQITEICRLKKIIRLMEDLGIADCGSTYICHLSGGERRRLSIAVQMLTDPLLLFCDEPTTGLDSSSSGVVMKLLKKFSSKGKIVICSIHQPTASIFELFDLILLLAAEGRVAYFGSVSNAITHFQKLDLHCPPSYNIAEFLINNISNDNGEAGKRVKILCDFYSTSKTAAIVEERIKAACFENYLSSEGCFYFAEYKNDKQSLAEYFTVEKVSLQTQCSNLIWRSALDLRKNRLNHVTHIATYWISATLISLIFAQVTLCSENSIQNVRGYINCIVLETLYMFAYYEFNTFMDERSLMLREVSSGLYSSEAYYISKLVCKITQSLTEPVVYVIIIRSISRVFNHLTFIEFVLPFIIISIMSTAYGLMLSSVFDNVNVLMVIATAHEIPAYLLAGITYKISSLPPILGSLKYFSIFYYAIEVVTVSEWSKINDIDCHQMNELLLNGTEPWSPLEILADYGFDIVNYRDDLWILLTFAVIFHFVAYKIISRKCKTESPVY